WQFGRTIFHTQGDPGPLASLRDDFATHHATLTPDNLASVLLASGALPLLMKGVSVSGTPGIHRDAAIVDYHPVLAFAPEVRLVLYPHFYAHLTPGWFDRAIPFRRARGAVLDRTVVLAPSEGFIAALPGGVRPSRRDARRFDHHERRRRWR